MTPVYRNTKKSRTINEIFDLFAIMVDSPRKIVGLKTSWFSEFMCEGVINGGMGDDEVVSRLHTFLGENK